MEEFVLFERKRCVNGGVLPNGQVKECYETILLPRGRAKQSFVASLLLKCMVIVHLSRLLLLAMFYSLVPILGMFIMKNNIGSLE